LRPIDRLAVDNRIEPAFRAKARRCKVPPVTFMGASTLAKSIRTMEEFSEFVGLSRPTVSKYFNDPASVR